MSARILALLLPFSLIAVLVTVAACDDDPKRSSNGDVPSDQAPDGQDVTITECPQAGASCDFVGTCERQQCCCDQCRVYEACWCVAGVVECETYGEAVCLPSLCGDVSEDVDATDVADSDTVEPTTGDGMFVEGCPVPGRATARAITSPEARFAGPDALGGVGDWLVMNEQAAFVISRTDWLKTYWSYGGIVIDAVALDGCTQAGLDRFEELVPIMGSIDMNEPFQSVLRGFHGESVEILNDGADGAAAVVRVHGRDDLFWLVDLTLVAEAAKRGERRSLSGAMGMAVVVDYVLEPGSSVLRVEVRYRNLTDQGFNVLSGIATWFGDTTDIDYFADDVLAIEGYEIDLGVPWLMSDSPDGAWALTMARSHGATVNVAGVRGFLDVDQVLIGAPRLGPAGGGSDEKTVTYYLAVGAGGANTATRHLQAERAKPMPSRPAYVLSPIAGQLLEEGSGAPVTDAVVDVQLLNHADAWDTLDRLRTDANGQFAGEIPDFGRTDLQYRLAVRAPHRVQPAAIDFFLPTSAPFDVVVGPQSTIAHTIVDGDGVVIPTKVELWENGARAHLFFTGAAPGREAVRPGNYEVVVTRGYEYEPWTGTLDLAPGQEVELHATLPHVVDTTGFMGMDSHVHAGPSPDSRVTVPVRIQTVAAEGLEVVIGTDHESVSDWSWGVAETGLQNWVATVIGQEVTAGIPEHTNMFPVEQRFDLDGRGGIVPWYGLDIAEIFAAEKARGAGLSQLNHPRNGCNYMCLIGYDRVLGDATLTDPTFLALAPDATLWSWDLDLIEYQNGNEPVFVDPSRPDASGLFDDWMSFHNHGYRVLAAGVTDTHGLNPPGSPRTYFASTTDTPTEFDADEMVASVKGGRALVSTGAFARVDVNGTAGLGDTLTDTDGQIDVNVHIEALPGIDVTYFKVFANCDQVASVATTAPDAVVKVDTTVPVTLTADAHVVVLGFGANRLPRGLQQFDPTGVPRFTTNPIFVDVDGNGVFDPPGGKTCLYTLGGP